MSSWWVQRQLRQTSQRLRAARKELAIAEEQSFALSEGTADLESMDRHRDAMRQRIRELEVRQDQLLDRLGSR